MNEPTSDRASGTQYPMDEETRHAHEATLAMINTWAAKAEVLEEGEYALSRTVAMAVDMVATAARAPLERRLIEMGEQLNRLEAEVNALKAAQLR